MALLFMDSFDHYVTADVAKKWTTSTISGAGSGIVIVAGAARTGAAGLRANYGSGSASGGLFSKTLVPSGAGVVIGFAFRTDVVPPASNGTGIVAVFDGGTPQLSFVLLTDMRLQVKCGTPDGGTVLGTTAAAITSVDVWCYLEVAATIDPAAGVVTIRVNGVEALSLTGQNTRNTAATQWTAVRLGIQVGVTGTSPGVSRECDYDDLYVLDQSGSAPWNTFLGDCRVDPCLPTGAGATTGWTPSAGANWQCVDDAAPNDDTDYTSATTPGLTDTFVIGDAPTGVIYGVQAVLIAKKVEIGTASLSAVVRHSGVDYPGAEIPASISYSGLLDIFETNPATGLQFTTAEFNAAEFGYQKVI